MVAINGTRLQPIGPGTTTITASQAGDTTYLAATSKTFITVTKITPYADTFPGLVMWLDGKDINGDGLPDTLSDFLAEGKVESWADLSGNSNTFTQSNNATQPNYSIGGGLEFDGEMLHGSLPEALAGNPSFYRYYHG